MLNLVNKIKYFGLDDGLRRVCGEVENFDFDLETVIIMMINLIKKDNHYGLSANQIGINKRLFVYYDLEKKKYDYMINPILQIDQLLKCKTKEQCLSLPGIEIEIERYKNITVHYQDMKGKKCIKKYTGQQAVIVQHELDHLNGLLIIDHVSTLEKHMYLNNKYKQKLKWIKKVRRELKKGRKK
jgi:peptide deformylase